MFRNRLGEIWQGLKVYKDQRMLILTLLGFSSGLPILLIGSTLSLWLTEEKLSLTTVGLFAWALLPYKLKPLWAPFVDRFNVPFIGSYLGKRRGWLWLTQLCLAGCIIGMSLIDPHHHFLPSDSFVVI